MAQRFFNLVLLPRIRDDIAEYKKLNFHLYCALKKALFKPGAWFKGKGDKGLKCRRSVESKIIHLLVYQLYFCISISMFKCFTNLYTQKVCNVFFFFF